MSFFSRIYGTIAMIFALALPAAPIGWAIAELEGIFFVVGLAVFTVGVVGLFCEEIIIRVFSAPKTPPEGIQTTLNRVIEDSPELEFTYRFSPLPRVLVFPDPAPNALVFRGLKGPGTVLLSQGLVSSLREQELRKVICRLILECRSHGILVSSISAVLASTFLSIAPKQWVRSAFVEQIASGPGRQSRTSKGLDPRSVLLFLLVFPFVEFFLEVGKRTTSRKGEETAPIYKMPTLQSVWSLVSKPGFTNLYLTDIKH